MYVELITSLSRAKDDIPRACRRCRSTLYIVFNIAKVGGPHKLNIPKCTLRPSGMVILVELISRVMAAGIRSHYHGLSLFCV